jgi:hypothetical protein
MKTHLEPGHGRMRSLTDSIEKENGKFWRIIIQKINIGHQHDRWMELKEALRVETNAEV